MKNEYHEKKLFELLKKGKFNDKSCLEWVGPIDKDGYGITTFSDGVPKKTWKVHRLIFLLLKGNIEEGNFICHACDNPRCFNLCHLFEGTPKDNSLDRKHKGRNGDQRGEKNGSNRLPDKIVLQIRKLYSEGMRVCELVRMFNVQQGTVSKIVHRKRWIHI
jgi:hypothetical protein